MSPDGSDLVNLTDDLAEDYDPSWSPDGTKIVFARSTGGDYFHLFSMNADGTGEQQLTNEAVTDAYPAWSPDGTKIAFTRIDETQTGEIFVMNADGQRADEPHERSRDRRLAGVVAGWIEDRLECRARREPRRLSHGRRRHRLRRT